MIQNQLKLTFRTLWKNRFFTALHVVGLAIGLSAAWTIFQWADFELAHDRPIPDSERIFRVVSRFEFDGKPSGNAGCPEPFSRAGQDIAGVEKSIPVFDRWTVGVLPEGTNRPFTDPEGITVTTPDYFEMVPYRWLAGSPATALSQPKQAVLTRSSAEKYFPRHQPQEVLGKMVSYDFQEDTLVAEVVGVVEDLDFPTSFIGKDFLTAEKPLEDAWNDVSSSDQLWFMLSENAHPETIVAALDKLSASHAEADEKPARFELQPISKVHFDPSFGSHIRSANPKVLAILAAIAGFLLLLACINYINLTTAQIPARSREIGIRKTLGGQNAGLISSFLVETVLVCLMAVLLSVVLTKWAFLYFEKDLPESVLKFADWRKTGGFLALLVVFVSLVSGLYPGWLITRFQAVSLLRGQFSGQNQSVSRRAGFRKGLIVFQFFIAQVFIIGALVVGRQLHFMLTKDLGFDREAVVLVFVPYRLAQNPLFKNRQFLLADALRKLPEVQKVALGEPLFSGGSSSSTHHRINEKGEKIELPLYLKRVDTSLLEFYGMPLLAGRNFTPSDTVRDFVINETACQVFGLGRPADAVGQILKDGRGRSRPISGVVADFHTGSFEDKMQPVAIMTGGPNLRTINVKLAVSRPADWPNALQKMEAEWAKTYPGEPFKARFYDETLAEIYAADLTLGRFINLATGVAILISCLGLFGLATFTALRRTKEIGVRKVLGASAASVVGLLSKEFLLLVAVGFGLAVPLAVFFLQKWLANYAFRIELEWWLVAFAGLAGVLLAFLTVGFQAIKAALANPVESLRTE